MTPEEMHVAIRNSHSDVELRDPDHLYIPGRVILAFNPWITEEKDDDKDPGALSCRYQFSGGFSVSAASEPRPYECTIVRGRRNSRRLEKF
jgi:hypothetical protein